MEVMPVLGADCHAHLLGHGYPLDPDRGYDPEPGQIGTLDRFLAVLDAHGLSHGLVVAAEPFGTDNTCILEGIARSGGRLKGIALVRPDISGSELLALKEGGIVGVRYNLTSFGMSQVLHPASPALFSRLAELDMFLQIHCEKDELAQAAEILARSSVRLMIDHFGRPDVARSIDQPGFRALLDIGRRGDCAVKLSGPFRSSREMPPYADVEPFIAAAVEAFTLANCVWGSDWPFVRVTERIDYGPELACVNRWFPDAGDHKAILANNPARLFGFS
jgi:predicted TIM-barrel fold metal-dependent hydrolase